MSDIKLFRISQNGVQPLVGSSVAVEKSLQTLIEGNLEAFLGVRFVKSEHSTSKAHGGRIDTLGLDENNCPVIVEYKRAMNENVINQGLYYLNWLMDHKAEFKLLVLEKFGTPVADAIDWSSPRLLCIAGDFTKYDEQAIQQIPRNIELIRYRRYGEELLLLELVNATVDGGDGGDGPKPGPLSYQRFFQSLIDRLRDEYHFTNGSKGLPKNWYAFPTGVSGFVYAVAFTVGKRVRVEVYINTRDLEKNKQIFDVLAAQKLDIESDFGEPLEWERLDGKHPCRIAIYRPGSIKDDARTLSEIEQWCIDHLLKMKSVFDQRLASASMDSKQVNVEEPNASLELED